MSDGTGAASIAPPDFGEPWRLSENAPLCDCGCSTIDRKRRMPCAPEDEARKVACVNALAGIADPEAFVKAADALADKIPYGAHGSWNALLDAYRAARGKP